MAFASLPELYSAHTASVFDMLELKLLEPIYKVSYGMTQLQMTLGSNALFAFGVEVDAVHDTFNLVEANIIKAFKACAVDRPDAVIRNQKVLLPAHKNILLLQVVFDGKISLLRLLLKRTKRRKFGPMRHVNAVVGTPGLVLCIEAILGPDNFALKVRGQCRMVLSQACSAIVSTWYRFTAERCSLP